MVNFRQMAERNHHYYVMHLKHLLGLYIYQEELSKVIDFVYPMIEEKCLELIDNKSIQDPKSQLQEWSQANGLFIPSYHTKTDTGPDHAKIFEVEVIVNGEVMGVWNWSKQTNSC